MAVCYPVGPCWIEVAKFLFLMRVVAHNVVHRAGAGAEIAAAERVGRVGAVCPVGATAGVRGGAGGRYERLLELDQLVVAQDDLAVFVDFDSG